MIKRCTCFFFLIGLHTVALSQRPVGLSQTNTLDSLKNELAQAKDDSNRIMLLHSIGYRYETINVDSALKYDKAALQLARQRSYAWAEADLMASLSGVMKQQGKLPEALELLFKSLKMAEENDLSYSIARAYRRLGTVYYDLENFPKAIAYLSKALHIDEEKQRKKSAVIDHVLLGYSYEKMNKLDSAAIHIEKASKEADLPKDVMQDIYEIEGHIRLKEGNYAQAAFSYHQGLAYAQKNSDVLSSSKICADISALYAKLNRKDSALFYALKGFDYAKAVSFKKGLMLTSSLLAELYDSIQPSVALHYYKIAAVAKDSLFGVTNIQAIQNLVAREEAKQKELAEAAESYRNQLRWYGLLTGLVVLSIIAFALYGNNRQKHKANLLLQRQKGKIETTLTELKATQSQLIQSEKMASLGQLTAGIAHEIQNPLNFVNNFAELSSELVAELNAEVDKEPLDKDYLKGITTDLTQNLSKIHHHGQRADAIVKGMLQHSRPTTGEKQPTDLNALAEEYLRLAYHGIRAKEKDFKANLVTDFDATLGKVAVVPQEIGRVLLNLFNNAFYATQQKKSRLQGQYEPQVQVSTKKLAGKVEIRVRDNGTGIADNVQQKIFQPFFTTKPTGQGTGLGLSLSYDITRGHAGELTVESKEGAYTEFLVVLPIQA